jgi:hypothetical protein
MIKTCPTKMIVPPRIVRSDGISWRKRKAKIIPGCRAEDPKDTEKKDIFGIQGRPQNKIEGEEKQSCEEILIEGDEHARVLKSQFSIQDSEHSES